MDSKIATKRAVFSVFVALTGLAACAFGQILDGRIQRDEAQVYFNLMSLPEAEMEVAEALYDDYVAAHVDAKLAFREILDEHRRNKPQEGRTRKHALESYRLESERKARLAEIQQSFFDDLRMLQPLSEDADQIWTRVQWARNRHTLLPTVSFPEASIDLVRIAVDFQPAVSSQLEELLLAYERELDSPLAQMRRTDLQWDRELPKWIAKDESRRPFREVPSLVRLRSRDLKVWLSLIEIHGRYTRRIAKCLEESAKVRFRRKVHAETFPYQLAISDVETELEAAATSVDLNPTTRQLVLELSRDFHKSQLGILDDFAHGRFERQLAVERRVIDGESDQTRKLSVNGSARIRDAEARLQELRSETAAALARLLGQKPADLGEA